MGIRFEELRDYLLSLPGVAEGTAYGSPIFRIKRKMIARLREDRATVVLHIDSALRKVLIEQAYDQLTSSRKSRRD